MRMILFSWIFLLSCTNSQSATTTEEATTPTEKTTTTVQPEVAKKEEPVKQIEVQTEPVRKAPEKKAQTPKVIEKEIKKEKTPVSESTPVVKEEKKAAPAVAAVSDANWDALLQKYVSIAGKVNYKGLKKEEAELDKYLAYLSANVPDKSAGRKTQMAYWINAYNAFTIKLILKNYPVKSIMDINGGKAWDLKFVKLGGKTYTLNDIEHKILRPRFKDARIHFAVNCAARSCPPISNHAWTAANLESTLEQKASAFINNTKYNQISAKKLKLSNIFNWYKEDFGDLIAFLNKYSKVKIEPNAKISYIDYDWRLNE